MKVIFFRHLPTQNNINNVFIGRMDLECDNKYIIEHLTEIQNFMHRRSFSKLFCSPLKRAKQSASIFFPNESFVIDRRLIERDLGDWKNMPKQIVKEQYPSAFFSSGNLDFNFTPPNGEPFGEVIKRVASFLLDTNDNFHNSDEIGIVTHNGIITAVKCLLDNTMSTENIVFQPFLTEFKVEITPELLDNLYTAFSQLS